MRRLAVSLFIALAASAYGAPALAQTTVPADWSLKPSGLTGGDQFRLLFLSSTKRDAIPVDIAEYNTFIQNRAAAGHADIQAYSAGFKVVGCTIDDDVYSNADLNGVGIPIYWLNGNKVADNYGDFLDGDWDDEVNDKNESGTDGPDTSQEANYPFTGCNHDGTKADAGADSHWLGAGDEKDSVDVRVGRPNSSTSGDGPIGSATKHLDSNTRPMYGLSAVFRVNAPTGANGTVTTTADTAYTFSAGDFGFMDALGGSLARVTITQLPGRGALKLGATTVYKGESVPQARIDADDFTYTPPRGQIGEDMSFFRFRVHDGTSESVATYRMTIDVSKKLVGNLGQTSAVLSLPDTSVTPNINAYAQRFRTGTSAQVLAEVDLAITAPTGTVPKVSIWHGRNKPERELFALSNPSNIHTAADAVKTFAATRRHTLSANSSNAWIVIERTSGSGTISLKRGTNPGAEDARAQGWDIIRGRWKRAGSDSWSAQETTPLLVELRTISKRLQARVTDMEISGPGPDELYTHGERLRITTTFTDPVYIAQAKLHVGPPGTCRGSGGHDLASLPSEDSGNGTNRIHFDCIIQNGPYTRIAVMQNSLDPVGAARRLVSSAHAAVERTTAVHGMTGPEITRVRVGSPGTDGVWTAGEDLKVRYTFNGPVTVATGGGTPFAVVQAQYANGLVTFRKVPYDRVDDGNTAVFTWRVSGPTITGMEIREGSVYQNRGAITGTDTKALADLSHRAYAEAVALAPPCGSTFPDEIWCAELTVGGTSGNLGFERASNRFGDLSPTRIIYGGIEYTVNIVKYDVPSTQFVFNVHPSSGRTVFDNTGFALRTRTHSYALPAFNHLSALIWLNAAHPGWEGGRDCHGAADGAGVRRADRDRTADGDRHARSKRRRRRSEMDPGRDRGGRPHLQRSRGSRDQQRRAEYRHRAQRDASACGNLPARQRHHRVGVRLHAGSRGRRARHNGGDAEQPRAQWRRHPQRCEQCRCGARPQRRGSPGRRGAHDAAKPASELRRGAAEP